MKIEEIKKEVEKASVKYASQFDTDYQEHAESDFDAGANHIIDTYYSPLEASHRELLNVLILIDNGIKVGFKVRQEAITNAKKLINEK